MERQQDNIGWRKQCSVFPPPPIAHHCVSGVSVLHLALLYPGSVSQRIPVSHVRRWIPVIFSPADFEQVPTRAGFVRFMSISTLSARGFWLKINPPSQIFDQYSGWWSTFKWLNVYIARIGQLFWQHCCCNVFPKYLQGWISGQWGSVSTLAPIVVTRR